VMDGNVILGKEFRSTDLFGRLTRVGPGGDGERVGLKLPDA
jgi:hypothetical protein